MLRSNRSTGEMENPQSSAIRSSDDADELAAAPNSLASDEDAFHTRVTLPVDGELTGR
jgi:hypothetical protein